MFHRKFIAVVSSMLMASLLSISHFSWAQGFLEMPDTTELPDFERETMLKDLDIPSVRERDPDPEAGPRLNVTEFRLQGIVEYPKLGITREAIAKQIEDIRFDLMQEGEFTDSGFTLKELGELSNLLVELEKNTQDDHVQPVDVQQFVFLIREQLRKRGVTLGMIETVADTITQYYRERGFLLAKAYIPKQEVRDGVVTLTLLLGNLGEIEVDGAKRLSDGLVSSAFKRDIYKPVTNKNIDESLTLVNDIPGVQVQGYFSPGSQVGDTKMTVKVNEEKWMSYNVRLDNHGSESTSENRAYADLYIHNPLGIGDELYFALLKTYSPDQSTFGAFRYSSFIRNPRWRSSIGFSTNDFVSRNLRSLSNSFFTGESRVADVGLRYIFKRSRDSNYSTELKYFDIDTELDTQASITQENVNKVSLAFNFDLLNDKRRHLYLGDITVHHAETFEAGGFEGEQSGSESFISYDVSMLSFFSLPFTEYETRFLWKSSGQYSGKALSNLNQVSLTGPTRARAFGVNGFQSDDGVYLGVDWILPLPRSASKSLFGEPINRIFQPFLFADYSYGVINAARTDDDTIIGKLSDVGLGLKISHSGFSGSFVYGVVVDDDIDDLQEDTPTNQFTFELQFSF